MNRTCCSGRARSKIRFAESGEVHDFGVPAVRRGARALLRNFRRKEEKRLLAMKLRDFSLLYQGVEDFIRGKQLPKEEILGHFAACIPESKLLRNAHFLIDGFVGFNAGAVPRFGRTAHGRGGAPLCAYLGSEP